MALAMLLGGLRAAEVRCLRLADVDMGMRQVRVVGKGNKERTVPVDRVFFTELGSYLRNERPPGCAHPGVLRRAAGTDHGFGLDRGGDAPHLPHPPGPVRLDRESARTGCATPMGPSWPTAGIDLLVLRELMGHASPETTAGVRAPLAGHVGCRVRQGPGGHPMSARPLSPPSRQTALQTSSSTTPRFVAGLNDRARGQPASPQRRLRTARRSPEPADVDGPSDPARLADLARSHAWSFITVVLSGADPRPRPGPAVDKTARRPLRRVGETPRRRCRPSHGGRSPLRLERQLDPDVTSNGLAMLCLWSGNDLDELTETCSTPSPPRWPTLPRPDATPAFITRPEPSACTRPAYELRICDRTPARTDRRQPAWPRRSKPIPQTEIRQVALRYLERRRPRPCAPRRCFMRADSLIIFGEYLAAHHPGSTPPRATRAGTHRRVPGVEPRRPWRGRVARDKPVAPSVSKHVWSTCAPSSRTSPCGVGPTVRPANSSSPAISLAWTVPCPKRSRPDVDRDLMAAVAELTDPFARHGLAILRGTGMRLGELLDLELECLWDFGDRGTWVKVPLGKLGTERTVPLDEETLAAFDAWMALRGLQRALTHPRHGQPADFLFVERGRRLSAFRLRHGLDQAVSDAGLTGRGGQALRVTPHQLRHTYGTSLVNAGMSLQALMALMGHVSAEMTLRYASLASPTVRAAYEAAMTKVRARQALFVAATGRPRRSRPSRMAPLRNAQDSGRSWVLLPRPRRRRLPLRQHLRTMRQLRHRLRVPTRPRSPTRRHPRTPRRRPSTRLGLRNRPPRACHRQHRQPPPAAQKLRLINDLPLDTTPRAG